MITNRLLEIKDTLIVIRSEFGTDKDTLTKDEKMMIERLSQCLNSIQRELEVRESVK